LVFTLANGPLAPVFPAVPSDGLLPLPNGVFARARPLRMRLPRLDAYNLTVQHQITNTLSAEIAYVGNYGHGFYQNNPDVNVNQPSLVGFGTIPQNLRRPFARFGWTHDINFFGNDAMSSYNALQTKVEKRFSNGLQFVAHYTWSNSLDHDRDYFAIDPHVNYGPDDANRKHVFSISSVYELPFGKGKRFMGDASRLLDLLIGGFQLNTTTNWSSGLPWTPQYKNCNSDKDTGPCRPLVVGSLSQSLGSYDPSTGAIPYYTPVAEMTTPGQVSGPFQRPQPGTFGSGRNPFYGPRFFNSDFSLFKNFQISERVGAQFRFEAFNVFNNVNPGQPNNCVDCGGGKITGLAPNASMRQLNFGAKITF